VFVSGNYFDMLGVAAARGRTLTQADNDGGGRAVLVLSHLGWTVELDQTEIGRWPVREVPIRMSATPTHIGGTVGRSGPSYGEDNDYVLGEILGLGPSEIDTLRSDGVV